MKAAIYTYIYIYISIFNTKLYRQTRPNLPTGINPRSHHLSYILRFHPHINIRAHIMPVCTISTTTLNHSPTLTLPVLHAHMHTCAHTRWIAIYNVCTWQNKKCTWKGGCFVSTPARNIDFQHSFLRLFTHSLHLAYPYNTHISHMINLLCLY